MYPLNLLLARLKKKNFNFLWWDKLSIVLIIFITSVYIHSSFFIMVTKLLPTLNRGIINSIFLSSAEDQLYYTSIIPLLPSDTQMLPVHDHPAADQDTQILLSTFATHCKRQIKAPTPGSFAKHTHRLCITLPLFPQFMNSTGLPQYWKHFWSAWTVYKHVHWEFVSLPCY